MSIKNVERLVEAYVKLSTSIKIGPQVGNSVYINTSNACAALEKIAEGITKEVKNDQSDLP
jgi:hypothetical protein